jgi:hypothetical protein
MQTKAQINKLIANHTHRLQILEERQSILGLSADPGIVIQIEKIKAEIERLQAALERAEEAAVEPPFPDVSDPAPQTATAGGSRLHVVVGDGKNVVIGNNISHVNQTISEPRQAQVSETDLAVIAFLFRELQNQVATQAPPEKKAAALERVGELHEAITATESDYETMVYVRKWFGKNIPHLVRLVSEVLTNPLIGKVVEARGGPTAAKLKQQFGQE